MDEVDLSVADYLVRDVNVAALGIPDLGDVGHAAEGSDFTSTGRTEAFDPDALGRNSQPHDDVARGIGECC
jgi:hypothetical protein